VIEAPDLASARAIAERDPYVTQKVFASVEVIETRQVFPEGSALGVFEALGSARAMRRLKPDPVSEELIEKLIWAATRASNPGNSQGWEFVVVRDAERRRALRDAIAGGMSGMLRAIPADGVSPAERRMREGAMHLVEHLDRVPVIIAVCSRRVYPPGAPQDVFLWSAVYPASQNLVVAARALGLGSVFTTFQTVAEPEVRRILGIPDDVFIGTLIPVGWPERPFGPVRRKPVEQVIHRDRW
jgi:nitroreductase